jgi:hypothetical protein
MQFQPVPSNKLSQLPEQSATTERSGVAQLINNIFVAVYGQHPKNEQLLICRVHRELTGLYRTLAADGYAFLSDEHEVRLGFLRFLADALKPYQVEGNAVTMFFTVNQLKPAFTERFVNAYLNGFQALDQAALTLFLSLRELAGDIRELYPDQNYRRLISISKALL